MIKLGFSLVFRRLACAVINLVAVLTPTTLYAEDLAAAVDQYFTIGNQHSHAKAVCDATLPDRPEHITITLRRALRMSEALGYLGPHSRKPAGFDRLADCLWRVSENASPRGMVLGAYFSDDVAKRLVRWKRAAELGDPEAMWRYATESHQGAANYEHWALRAAQAGHPLAQMRQAFAAVEKAIKLEESKNGNSLEADAYRRDALRWYEMYATNSNSVGASCSDYAIAQNYFEGVELCSLGELRGAAKAHIAKLYFDGKYGITQDYGRSAMWFRAAIADGVYLYGVTYTEMLEKGLGVDRDERAAETIRSRTAEYIKKHVITN